MAESGQWQVVCPGGSLEEGGEGVRFEVHDERGTLPAFAVRVAGQVRAYINRCSHVPIELDWIEGHFLDEDPAFIVCATHGATYDSLSGACVAGPCAGKGLERLEAVERDDVVLVRF